MRSITKFGLFGAALLTGYITFGYTVLGYNICVTKGKLMSPTDRVEQLRAYVHEMADRKRTKDKSFVLAPTVIEAVMDKFGQCVKDRGFLYCEQIKFELNETDVGFYFANEVPNSDGADFAMSGTGKNGFSRWGVYDFTPLGCWFTGYYESAF
jgi:hypothetical protein